MSALERFVERHPWARWPLLPIMLPYALWKFLKALTEWRS